MNSNPVTRMELRGRRLIVARMVWVALVILALVLFAAALAPYYQELRTPCRGETCLDTAISPEGAQALQDAGLSMAFYAGFKLGKEILLGIVYILLGLLIFWQGSADRMGLLVSLTLVLIAIFFSDFPAALVNEIPRLAIPVNLLTSLAVVCFIALLFLFPDGRFVPRWARMIIAIIALFLLLASLLAEGAIGTVPGMLGVVVGVFVLGGFLVGLLAQVYRYRRVSAPMQRQQTKWVVFSLGVTVLAMIVWPLGIGLFPPGPARLFVDLFGDGVVALLVYPLFPISLAIAILRYRLWEIDALINRTMVYGALTGALALVYFGSVVLLQSLFRALTGRASQAAVVVSTLAIAALFNPVRRHIQDLIDRRFYRERYDAQQVLAAFAETARDETSLDRLTDELLRVVEETMQPTRVSLWLRPTSNTRPGTGEEQTR